MFFTDFIGLGFHHHTDQWLCTTLAKQDSSIISKCFLHLLCGCKYICVFHNFFLTCNFNIHQKLWVDRQSACQFRKRHLLFYHCFHDLQGCQNAITRSCILRENDMSTLLTAEDISVLHHTLIDIFVSDCSLLIADSLCI